MARLHAVLAAVMVAGCAVPSVAAASTVTVDPATREAVFIGGPRANDVTMASGLLITDAAQKLRAGTGCVAGVQVLCQAFDARVSLDGGNDRFDAFTGGVIIVNGGSG